MPANALSKRLGPLPAWGWGLVIAGGLLAGIWLRRRAGAQAAATAANTGSYGPVADTSGGSVGGNQAPAGSGLPPPIDNGLVGIEPWLSGPGAPGSPPGYANAVGVNTSYPSPVPVPNDYINLGPPPSPTPYTSPTPTQPTPFPTPVAPAPTQWVL